MSVVPDLEAWLDAFLRDRAFLERYPYYVAVLGKLHPVSDPSVKRMAVSLFESRFFLHVNVESFVAEPQYLRGILLHEVHHIVLGHLGHPKFADVDAPDLMDLAIEMSANEFIEEPLPDPIVWSAFKEFGIKGGQSTLERYECLVAAARAKPELSPRQDALARRVDEHRFVLRRERSAINDGGVEHTRQLLLSALDEVARQEASIEEDDPSRYLLAGRDPGRLVEQLTGTLGEVERFVDWRHALRMFVARSRAPVHTWSRPSRRFPTQIGVIPGRTYSPRSMLRPSLLIAIDTSMSMTATELEEVARHLSVLSNLAMLTVVECDVQITRVYPFLGALTDAAGRGGTDLRPVFEPSFLRSRKVDGVIYFTDGQGPFPAQAPPIAVLWVLTKPGAFGCPWGARAELSLGGASRIGRNVAAKKSGSKPRN